MSQRVEDSVEVGSPIQQVYEYWETLENLPTFMSNVEEVRSTGEDTTHWRIKGPLGTTVEFDARTTQKERNGVIAWNSEDGDVQTSGQVRFQKIGDERTRLEVVMNYADPPGGKVGETASNMISDPQMMLKQDLVNFKEIMEGHATPEDIQQRPSVASVQGGALAFLTSGIGFALVGSLLLVLLLRQSGSRRHKRRIILEF